MTAEAKLVVGLMEVAGAEHQFRLVVPFKTGARDDVEHSVRPVAEFRAIAAAVDL